LVTALELKKTRNDGAIWPIKKFDDILSHVDTIHEPNRQMDRHWPTASTT